MLNGTRNIVWLIVTTFMFLSGCAVTPQKVVMDNGWIPLDSLDFVKFDSASISSQTCTNDKRPHLLGLIRSFKPLRKKGWFEKTYTLPTSSSILAGKVDFSACYAAGPDKLFQPIGYSIKVSNINVGTFADAGIEINGSSEITLDKVWRSYASMSDEQKVLLLQKLDTDGGAVFVTTDTLFADISNVAQFSLKGGAKINADDFKMNVDVVQLGNDNKQERLKGLSIGFGVRGNLFKKESTTSIPRFAIPNLGATSTVSLPNGQYLTVMRTASNFLDFRLDGGSQATVYKHETAGNWVADKESVMAALHLPDSPMPENEWLLQFNGGGSMLASVDIGGSRDIIPEPVSAVTSDKINKSIAITDIRIVSTSLGGNTSNVITLLVTGDPSDGSYYAEGRQYKITSNTINTVEEYNNSL